LGYLTHMATKYRIDIRVDGEWKTFTNGIPSLKDAQDEAQDNLGYGIVQRYEDQRIIKEN